MNRAKKQLLKIEGEILAAYVSLLIHTTRLHVEGHEHLAAAEASQHPILWSTWHGQSMGFQVFGYQHVEPAEYVAIAIGDERYDVLATYARRMGMETVPVDPAETGIAAGRSVLNVIRALRRGKGSFLFPDGPDGPALQAKPGIFFIARKARAAVLPVAAWSRQAFEMRRWDRFLVPFPFGKIHVVVGEPIYAVQEDTNESLAARIVPAMNAVRARARLLAGKRA